MRGSSGGASSAPHPVNTIIEDIVASIPADLFEQYLIYSPERVIPRLIA